MSMNIFLYFRCFAMIFLRLFILSFAENIKMIEILAVLQNMLLQLQDMRQTLQDMHQTLQDMRQTMQDMRQTLVLFAAQSVCRKH